MKKMLFVLAAGSLLLSSGCGTGSWLKWITVASQLAYNITGSLDNTGVLTG